MSEPFLYRGWWCVWYKDADGKRRRKQLAKTKRAAFDAWKSGLAAGQTKATGDPQFGTIAAKWLAAQQVRCARGLVSESWLDRCSWTIEKFMAANPRIKCSQITPEVAVSWLPEGSSLDHERTSAGAIKGTLKWAVSSGLIASSPLAAMKLERGGRREALVTLEDHRRLVAATKLPRFRALLWFAWWTGARPTELRLLRWEHMQDDCSRAVMREHKTAKKVGKARTIYFNATAQRLLKAHRKLAGPVFLNKLGKPWTKGAIVRRMDKLRTETGIVATAYTYRHSFITRALTAGEDIAVVAELTGTSIEMISRNYGHLDKAKSHLAEAARRMR